jgi:hypothetical protein
LTEKTVLEEEWPVSSGMLRPSTGPGKERHLANFSDDGTGEYCCFRTPASYCGRRSAMMCQCQEPGLRCCCLQTVRDASLLKTAEGAIMASHWPDSGGNVGPDSSNAFATIRDANGEGRRA